MATLSGIVTDPSGAVISNAEVALEGTSESVARQTVTNSTGTYVIPSILPGTYRLSVKANGFESHAVDNIILSSGQGSTINVILQVGEAKAVVTVTEKSPLLETTTATMGTTVTAQKITSLPLRGRNFSSLLTTLPGVAPFDYSRENLSPGATAINPPVNGQRPRDNEYTLDGVPNMEVIFNAVAMFPPPEAIAEMKVQSGMDSGAFGWSSGADIDVVTKSGTNQYHGDVWEYLQNGSLNARSYFSPSVGAYQWNQFGGAFGGPLVIPHLLSKRHGWYIFGYYEGLRDNSSGPFTSFVPTTAEMNGDFTGDPPIYNPYTTVTDSNGQSIRQQFPGNIIPSGSTTLCAPQPTCINSAAEIIYRGLIPTANFPSNIIPGVNYVGHSVSRNTYDNWSARVDHQFGAKDNFFGRYSDARNPQSSVSFPNLPSLTHARYTNIDAGDIHTFGPSTVLTARFGMQRTNYGSVTGGPNVAVQAGTLDAYPPFHGFQAIPPLTIPGFPSVSQGVQIYGPEYMYTLSGDVQKTFGRHTFGFGAAFYRGSFITDNQTSVSENFTTVPTSNFAGGTGDALASYLLGLPSSAGREIGSSEGNMLGYAGGLYAQDSWQINSKLHLNLGLRWDYAPPMINVVGSGTFSWETGQYYWDVKNPITGQPANIRRGLIPPDRRDFQPRIGIAYAVSPKTVGRASYAIYTGNLGMNWGQEDQNNRGNWPFGSPQSEGSLNATLPTAFLQNPFPPGPAVPSSTPQGALLGMEVVPSGSRSPMTQEWSASVQQQLTPSTKLELDYFGSHSIHLVSEMVDNTATTPGLGPFQARQRWPQFPPYTNGGYNMFPSFYDGGDVSLTNQHSRNLSLLINYTYSKVIDYVDEFEDVKLSNLVPTRFTIPSFRGPAQFSTTNRLVGSYVYDIPVHPKNRLLNAIAGGWEHSGIVGIDSGFPYYAFLTTDQANIGAVGGRPDQFPNLLFNPGANFHPTANEWFNTAAYQLPVFGTFGNAGKHALYGPGEVNWDASLAKKWPFGEGRDVGFKAEFFNLPNFSTFADPGSVFGTSQFGKVNGTRQGGRVIQFALKIHF